MKLSIVHNGTFGFLTTLLLICLGVVCLASADSNATEPKPPRRKVLILYSWHERLPWQAAVSAGLQERLQQEPDGNSPEIYEMHLDSVRINNPAMDGVMYAYLKNRYASMRFDVVITESTNAALFLQRHPDLFPKEKVFAINFEPKPGAITGKHLEFGKDADKALRTILQVMPDREHLLAVVGDSAEGRAFKAELVAAASSPAFRVPLKILDTFTFEELYATVRNLPPRSAILYFPTQYDRNGVLKTPRDVVKRLSAVANAPVFVHHDTFLGTGVVGGYVVSARREGELIGHIALGLPLPASIAEIDALLKEYRFDSDQLQRWGISEGRLPVPHTLINRKPSLWETHPWHIIGVLLAILCEALLIAALIYYSCQRKKMVSLLAEERDLLEQRVQERSRELMISNEQLENELAERNYANARLLEMRNRLSAIFATIPDLVWLKDTEGVYLACNPAFERFFGATEAEIIGKTDFDFVDAKLAEFFLRKDREAMTADAVRINEESITYAHDGSNGILETRKVPVHGADGTITGVLGISRDITERKRMEDELQRKNSELERFTYTVSHDLKSPIITIKSFSGSIKNDLSANRYDRVAKDLDRICTAADKMAALLEDLLKLSRVGRIINPPEPVDMAQLVDDVLKNMAGVLQESGVQITVQPALPTVMCDRQRMVEVLQNLVENAVKYRGDQPEPHIDIGLRQDGDQQVFFVQDNGPGIDPKYHENIFGLFNRLETTIHGTGVGLALVKRIVEVHGGQVWVESDGCGNGSTFCFTVG